MSQATNVCGICARGQRLIMDHHEARPGVTCGGSGMTPDDSYDNEKVRAHNPPAERLPWQIHDTRAPRAVMTTIPASLGEAAWQGYATLYGRAQSCQRIHERGGFGPTEIAICLAVAIDAGLVEIRLTDKAVRP